MSGFTFFKNAMVYTPYGVIQQGSLLVQNGRIASIHDSPLLHPHAVSEDEVFDLQGKKLLPGFIDVHVHGGGGFDVMNGKWEEICGMSQFHARRGTTSFLATTLTSDQKRTELAIESIMGAMHRAGGTEEAQGLLGAQVLGIHLEGPFINPKRCGAQNPEFVRQGTIEELQRYIELSKGSVRLMTIAPEMPGSSDLVKYAIGKGITISVGHSDAAYEQVKQSVDLGVSHITHLFNAMSPLHHREPGVAGAAMMLHELAVELICDGVHVHPELIDFVFRIKQPEKIVLITDAVAAAGLKDGSGYELGGLACYIKDGQVRLLGTHDLAGSCLTMDQALRNAMKFTGRPLHDVLPTLTLNPAKQIGVSERKGSIETGKDADLVILDEANEVVMTFVRGQKVFSR